VKSTAIVLGLAVGGALALTGLATAAPAAAATVSAAPASVSAPAGVLEWSFVGFYPNQHACAVDGAWYVHHTSGVSTYACTLASDGVQYGLWLQ
jgi:hypothetical protein